MLSNFKTIIQNPRNLFIPNYTSVIKEKYTYLLSYSEANIYRFRNKSQHLTSEYKKNEQKIKALNIFIQNSSKKHLYIYEKKINDICSSSIDLSNYFRLFLWYWRTLRKLLAYICLIWSSFLIALILFHLIEEKNSEQYVFCSIVWPD